MMRSLLLLSWLIVGCNEDSSLQYDQGGPDSRPSDLGAGQGVGDGGDVSVAWARPAGKCGTLRLTGAPDGSFFVSCSPGAPVDLGSGTVTPAGGSDILVAKIDPGDGKARWTSLFGDQLDQSASGIAATSSLVAVIGKFIGNLTFGGHTASAISASSFVGGVDARTGHGQWVVGVADLGTGYLASVAANERTGTVATCGVTDRATTSLDPKAIHAGWNDVVVAEFDSATGRLLWGRQIAGPGSEDCGLVAVDDNGDLFIFGSSTGSFLGGPAGAYVAKLSARDGSTIVATSFAPPPSWPSTTAITATGDVFIAGTFSGDLAIGGVTLHRMGGGSDAFVVRLSGSQLQPIWARRWGSELGTWLGGIAADSTGRVMVTGSFGGRATDLGANGAVITMSDSNVNGAMYVVRLDGDTGATETAQIHPSSGQNAKKSSAGHDVAIARLAPSPARDIALVSGSCVGTMDLGPAGKLDCGNEMGFLVRLQ